MGCEILKCVTTQGWLDVSRMGLATVNLQNKFEVPNYTHYEDMRSDAKCTNWGSSGTLGGHARSSAMSQFDRAHTTAYSTAIETMCLSCTVSILYRYRDIAGYLSKVADFDPPHLRLAPPLGVTPVEFHGGLRYRVVLSL